MSAHSPLPWGAGYDIDFSMAVFSTDTDYDGAEAVCIGPNYQANAPFIVQAVNNHEALLSIAQTVESRCPVKLDDLLTRYIITLTSSEIAELRAVIAKATGGEG